jgi:hypothetical protein
MKRISSFGRIASWLAAFAMISAPAISPAAAAAPIEGSAGDDARSIRVTDVALDASGALSGQAVTMQGAPAANAAVLLDDGRQQWQATTDGQGQFRFDGVRPGGYRLQSGGQVQFCRAWKAGTAPPAANRALMVVRGEQTVLGQYCGSPVGCGSPVCSRWGGCKELISNPLVIGGVIAAAIAIPIAVHNAGDDDPAS